ncbi:MAG: mannonate dehydratase [Acidobacteria bacterium]|nr:mannonate dehydratase [Acidobacteriota bacterium]
MQRRDFLEHAAAGALAVATPAASSSAAPKRKANLKLGTQHSTADAVLKTMAALGVNNICSNLPSAKMDAAWSVEALTKLRERVESFGLHLDMVPLPLSSAYITRNENPNILLGKSPERDREIDNICQMLRNVSRAGIPAVKYNMSILGVVRTESTSGRGGSRYSTFVYSKAKQDPPLTEAGPVPADAFWERITYFLERVVPVAAETKVKIACHPHDPGMPPGKGFRGVDRVLGSVAGLKRFVQIKENPYHGLNFCQGTVTEMLQNPAQEIGDVIRYFGSRGKLFNVHFRNIRGRFLDFQETFPDDGDVNMIQCLRAYKEIGYDGMLMPDHVPRIEGDEGGRQAFAFCFGYIRALIQLVNQEG